MDVRDEEIRVRAAGGVLVILFELCAAEKYSDVNSGKDVFPQPKQPTKAYEGDAGYDLYASRGCLIMPGKYIDVHTDVKIALPDSLWCRIVARSSSARQGLMVQEGIIDTGYRGEMFFGVWNMTRDIFKVEVGMRLAQMILMPHVNPLLARWGQVENLPVSERGAKGFGSSGK